MYFPIAAILLLIIVNATSTEPAYALFFGHSIDISNNTKLSSEPHLSLSRKSNVYVVWSDDTTGNGDIYFRASADNGTTFSKVKRLSNNTGSSTEPQIAASENNVYVVWSDDTTGNGDIYFRMSKDNGNTFSGIKNLSRNSTGSSTEPQIAASENNVYVVWSDDTTGNGDIYFRASENNGNTFSGPKNLSNTTGLSSDAKIATSGKSNVFVVWSDDTTGNGDIYFRASVNNGAPFSGIKNLSRNSTGSSTEPQIAASGKSNVYVVWSDDTTGDIYFRASENNGRSFAHSTKLIARSGNSQFPQMTISEKSNVYVVWSNDITGNGDIYFKASENNGSSFNNTRVLSRNSTGSSTEPQIATSGKSNVYVIWRNSTSNNTDIFFLASGDGAAHFDMPINLSKSSLLSGSHQIATSGNNVYVIWEDGITIGKGDIYFKRISEVFFPRNTDH